jgi:hypothetical protein
MSNTSVSLPSPTVIKMDSSAVERRELMDRTHETTDEQLKKDTKSKKLTKTAMNSTFTTSFLSELEKLSGSLSEEDQNKIHDSRKEGRGRAVAYGAGAAALANNISSKKRIRRGLKAGVAGYVAGKIHSSAINKRKRNNLRAVQSGEKANMLKSESKGRGSDPFDRLSAQHTEQKARKARLNQIYSN